MKCRTIIALASIAALSSPAVSTADSGFYGSLRLGLNFVSPGDDVDSDLTLENFSSRLGFKSDTDLANDMNVFGKVEYGISPISGSSFSNRHAYIGIRGDFGKITLGQTYHTWYNMVVGPLDQGWWGTLHGVIDPTGRTGEAISYEGEFGVVTVGATVYLTNASTTKVDVNNGNRSVEKDFIDGLELGAAMDVGQARVSVALQNLEVNKSPVLGAAVQTQVGEIDARVGVYRRADYVVKEADVVAGRKAELDDAFGIDFHAGLRDFYVTGGMQDLGDSNPIGITLGYTYTVGPQTTLWFEFETVDADDNSDADLFVRSVLKYNWR